MVIQDKREKSVEFFETLGFGDQFEWQGRIYVKTGGVEGPAFCLSTNQIDNLIPKNATVTRVNVTIIVEDYK